MGDVAPLAKWDPVHANDLGSAGCIAELNNYIASCFGVELRVRIDVDDDAEFWVAQWDVLTQDESRVTIGRILNGHRQDRLQWRIFNIMPLIAAYHRWGAPATGRVAVNLEDFGLTPGLAFCENRPDYFLIPDPDFVSTQGYAVARHVFSTTSVAWEDRARTVFWRGSDFGQRVTNWHELPRVRLCHLALQHGPLFDVGITDIRHGIFGEEIRASGLMRDHVPTANFNRYRAHIDIDGRTNAWSGLFHKLLSGSPVLKIASPAGYRQWYYDRLKPWVNFVPVASEMSDLVEKAKWLQTHDEVARQIGERGRALAMERTYEVELERTCQIVGSALRYFSKEPKISLRFCTAEDGRGHLRDGGSEHEDGGVPAPVATNTPKMLWPMCSQRLTRTLNGLPIEVSEMQSTQPDGNAEAANYHEVTLSVQERGLPVNEFVTVCDQTTSNPLVGPVKSALQRAFANDGTLSPDVLAMEGMSGRKYRLFVSNLIGSLEDARYLEVGVLKGSTLCSAIHGNTVRAVAIDNWSQFGGPMSEFLTNLARFKTAGARVSFLENDFRLVDFSSLGSHNVYLFDGPHSRQDQVDGVVLALPALDDQFVLIVDDWNWPEVREGTMAAVKAANLHIDHLIEIRTTLHGDHGPLIGAAGDWHNGYFIAAVSKR